MIIRIAIILIARLILGPPILAVAEEFILEPIVVTSSRTERPLADAPVATEVIGRQEIESSGANNAAEILSKHTGVEVTSSFRGRGIRLQGLESDYVLVLVDGERLTGRIGGVIDLSRFNAEDIERIEIVKGPSSALYGSDALGGVVNIITRKAKKGFSGDTRAIGGSLGTAQVGTSAGASRESWETFTTAGYHRRDAVDWNVNDLATNGNRYWEMNAGNRTRYEATTTVTLSSRLDYLQRSQGGISVAGSGAVFDTRNLTETFGASVGPEFRLTGPSRLSSRIQYSLFRDQFQQDQRNSNALDQYQETREQILLAGTQYDRKVRSHFVTVGSEASREFLTTARLRNDNATRNRLALYSQDEWGLLAEPRLVFLPGVRVDTDSQFGSFTSPKVALRFDPLKSVVLRAGYGWGFRAPSFKELYLHFENPSSGYVVEGNPNLKPETSQGVNFGSEWSIIEQFWVSANAFRNKIENLIDTQTRRGQAGEPDRYIYTNLASARTQGLESMVRYRIDKLVAVSLGYALTHTRDNAKKRMLDGRALHRVSAGIAYTNTRADADLTARSEIVGKRRFYRDLDGDGSDESFIAKQYVNLDINFEKRFLGYYSILAGVQNAFDAGDAIYLPIQPRTVFGGMKFTY